MDQCGEASAATKLSALTLQDRTLLTAKKKNNLNLPQNGHEKAEYFEFGIKDENWTQEFKSFNYAKDTRNSQGFEKAFKNARPPTAVPVSVPVDWVNDFKSVQSQKQNFEEFEKFNQIFDSISDKEIWEKEFKKYEINPTIVENNKNWIEEFNFEEDESLKDQGQDQNETAKSARILLESLDLSDSKLAESKFIAYLKELTENDPTINGTFSQDYNWAQEFERSMESAGLAGDSEDHQWKNLEKAWDQYNFSGQGYEQFAPKQFAQYRYSLEDSLNPFHGLGSDVIKSELPSLKSRDLAKYILALEEITRLRPDDAENWMNLGLAQAENELDVQAIAAFYRAVQMDSKMNYAWLGLGAACVNEYCVPDALDAFKTIVKNMNIPIGDESVSHLIAIFRNSSLIPDDLIRVGALSVLLNISGEHEEAISLLQNSTTTLPNDYSIWNRLGATLANAQRYDEALLAYERALSLNPTYVRALYNMGVSYMNQSNYPKAVGFMVRALQYHLSVGTQNDPSVFSEALRTGYDTIWNTMRIMGDMWGREDISVLIEERNLSAIMNILKEVL
jgi:tetratricopeptide (TPR) repeat protein